MLVIMRSISQAIDTHVEQTHKHTLSIYKVSAVLRLVYLCNQHVLQRARHLRNVISPVGICRPKAARTAA